MNTLFDWKFYVSLYDDLSNFTRQQALHHWSTVGKTGGRLGSKFALKRLVPKKFNWRLYKAQHPEVLLVGEYDVYVHWFRGGRQPQPPSQPSLQQQPHLQQVSTVGTANSSVATTTTVVKKPVAGRLLRNRPIVKKPIANKLFTNRPVTNRALRSARFLKRFVKKPDAPGEGEQDLYPHILSHYIRTHKLEPFVQYFGFLTFNDYNEIISACDLGIIIHMNVEGTMSGAVMDCLSVNKPVITTQCMVESMDINHKMLMGFPVTKYDDWVPSTVYEGGYSKKATDDMCDAVLEMVSSMREGEGKGKGEGGGSGGSVLDCVMERKTNYTTQLIKTLGLSEGDKIAFVTPFPPDQSGVADHVLATICELGKYIKDIDVFTDATHESDLLKKKGITTTFYTIDTITQKFANYKKVVFVVGNSPFHSKIILHFRKLGGVCVLHDPTLTDIYRYMFAKHSLVVAGGGSVYKSTCLDDVVKASPLIVHSKTLQGIVRETYGVDAVYIPFSPYNNLLVHSAERISEIKKKYAMSAGINIVVNGIIAATKCPLQALKVVEELSRRGVSCKVYYVGKDAT